MKGVLREKSGYLPLSTFVIASPAIIFHFNYDIEFRVNGFSYFSPFNLRGLTRKRCFAKRRNELG